MKKLFLTAGVLLAGTLSACSTAQVGTTANTNQTAAQWMVYCAGFHSLQPAILARIPTAPIAAVKTVVPLTDKIAAECSGPMPTDSMVADNQLAADITTVVVTLGLQAATGAK